MSFLNLFKSTGKKAISEGERGFIMMLEGLGMSDVVDDAQISKYDEALTKVSVMAAKAKGTFDTDKAAYDAINKNYDSKLIDAQKLQDVIDNEATVAASKEKFQTHLNKLLDEIEGMKPDLDSREQDMKDSKDHYDLLKQVVETKAGQLSHVKEALTKARRENQRLDVQRDRIKDREQEQKVVLGISQETDVVGSIVGAINRDSDKKKQDIEAGKLRLDALSHQMKATGSDGDIDPEVAAVLGKGGSPVPAANTADRLAALKRK